MTHVIVDPGVCGLTTDIKVQPGDFGKVSIEVETDCASITGLVAALEQPVDAFSVLGMTGAGPLLEELRAGSPVHASCPVVAGIVKAVEAAANMALPKDASIRFVD